MPPLLGWLQDSSDDGRFLYAADLSSADQVENLFRDARILRGDITRDGWKHLFERFGLSGLIGINRQADWFESSDDNEAAEQIITRSLMAGYDPVSGLFRGYAESRGLLTPVGVN